MLAADALAEQGRACAALGSPMYADLLDALADDLRHGGPAARVLAGHEDDPGPSALALRLLGSVHRLVLERRAGTLAAHYPSVGGTWEPVAGTRAFLDLLEREPDAVREWLDRPPQTNEVGRSAALAGGLRRLGSRLPVRLHEIGSSAGLNLLVGLLPGPGGAVEDLDVEVVERVGSDLHPVDATTTQGRLLLTAYVWPDQRERLERLRTALGVAAAHPPQVRRLGAGDAVADLELRPGTTTVLWHSVVWQYLPAAEQDRVTARLEQLGAGADVDRRLAHLCLEPARRAPGARREFLVVLTEWPTGRLRVLGTAAPHGVPVTWEDPLPRV